ncbi:hypothetical protein AB0C96_04215 [Streptomyces sp. NPDC048506]|uniref:hypothetical protein n=1 Tax=Streptomyces sp. NPDC048506 TaxID=3155028 RepID=UPI00342B2E00
MPIPTPRRRRHLAAAALLLSAATSLTACGQQRVAAGAPSASPSAGPATPGAGPATPGAGPATPGAGPAMPGAGASPYVEPGSHDGAPHYNDNNAHRRPREMSRAGAKDAQREADRIEPVLKRLWRQGKWDPKSVRAALLALGYEEQRTGARGERRGGKLDVRSMEPRFEDDHYVTAEGARIGLLVHGDACVTAFVQKSNYQVQVNGPYLESGCFEPPFGH